MSDASLVIGGSAAITAVGAARLGLRVGLCAAFGDDDLGHIMVQRLTAEGVDSRHLRREAAQPTGISVILDEGSDRAILTAPGPVEALSTADLAALGDAPARHVHVASYFMLGHTTQQGLAPLLQRWRTAGVSTSVDTNWDPHQRWDVGSLLSAVDVVLPNRAELAALSGVDDLEGGLRALAALGPSVICKLGVQGAVALTHDRVVRVAAVPSDHFVDSIGAGDSFVAGYLYGLLAGDDVGDRLRLAVATGSLSTRGRGGTAAQPDLATARYVAQGLAVTSPAEDLR